MRRRHRFPLETSARRYWSKWTGEWGNGPASRPDASTTLVTFVGAFLYMALEGVVSLSGNKWVQPIGSFGATTVLVYGSPGAPASQPRCVVLAQIVAALVGVACREWVAKPMGNVAVALPLSVALTLLICQHLRMINPPAGGTAAIAVLSSPQIEAVGWGFVVPAFFWAVVFVIVAAAVLNVHAGMRYPKYWIVAVRPKPASPAAAGSMNGGAGAAAPRAGAGASTTSSKEAVELEPGAVAKKTTTMTGDPPPPLDDVIDPAFSSSATALARPTTSDTDPPVAPASAPAPSNDTPPLVQDALGPLSSNSSPNGVANVNRANGVNGNVATASTALDVV